MNRYAKNLILITLALAVVIMGGWYLNTSASKAQAKVPWNAARISDIVNGMGDVANADLSSFGSLSEVSDVFRNVGGENATMGQMATWLDAFGQMGGGVEDLLDGNYRSLGDVVTGLGQITDLGGATDMLNSLGDLGANVDDILGEGIGFQNGADLIANLSEMTNLADSADIVRSFGDLGANVETLFNGGVSFDSVGDLFNSLDEISDYESVQNLFDKFGNDGGDWDDFVTNVANDGTDVSTVVANPNITPEELGAPGTGDGSQTQPRASENRTGVGTDVGNSSQEAKQKLEKERKQDEQECKASSGSGGRGSLLGDAGKIFDAVNGFSPEKLGELGIGSVDQLLSGGNWSDTVINAVSGATGLDVGRVTELAGKIPGLKGVLDKVPGLSTAAGLVGLGASYVPVVEQDGDLLDLTDDTNQMTGDIRDLQVQICTHLKTIKRVQLNFEDKEFIGDVKAREEASKRADEAQKQIFNRVETGGKTASGEDTTLKPDVEDYTKDWADQGAAQAVSQAKSSGNYNAEKMAKYTEYQNKAGTFANNIASDFSENQIKELTDPEQVKELNSQSLWRGILKLAEPQNNAYGQISMIWDKVSQEKSQGRENARLEFLSGGGYVPVKECVKEDENGVCVKYKVNSTGSTNQHAANEAASVDLQQTLNADEASDLNEDNVPGVAEFETLEPSKNTTNTGGPGGGSGPGGGFNLEDLADLFTNGDLDALFDLFGSDGSGNSGNFGGFSLRDILDLLNRGGSIGDLNLPPVINFKLTGPSLEQIYEGRSNVATISWKAQNADKCTARNSWLSSSLLPNRVEAVKKSGDNLETSGSLLTYLPLTFDIRLERTRGNQTVVIPFATSTNASLTQQVTTITLESSQVAAGDRFSLVAKAGLNDEAKVTIETNVANAGTVNNLLGAALTSLSSTSAAGQELSKYRITFTANESGTGFITITADPIYSIRCTSGGRNTDRTVTVSRGN